LAPELACFDGGTEKRQRGRQWRRCLQRGDELLDLYRLHELAVVGFPLLTAIFGLFAQTTDLFRAQTLEPVIDFLNLCILPIERARTDVTYLHLTLLPLNAAIASPLLSSKNRQA
jgi:hypothetical protein